MKRERLKELKPLNSVIQICPVCNKLDVYLNDGHSCEDEMVRQANCEFYEG